MNKLMDQLQVKVGGPKQAQAACLKEALPLFMI